MSKLLEEAIAAARRLPPPEQDDIARAILQLAGANEASPVSLTPAPLDSRYIIGFPTLIHCPFSNLRARVLPSVEPSL